MALQAQLVDDREQGALGELLQGDPIDQVIGVVPAALTVGATEGHDLGQRQRSSSCPGHQGRHLGLGQREGRRGDLDGPGAVRMAIRGRARRAVERSDLGPRVRCARGGVEGRILDVVAHGHHEVLTHGLHVHQRAAVVEVELTVGGIVHRVSEVQELVRRTDVELHPLEDGGDIIALEAEQTLHPLGVHGARAHPLVDGDVPHPLQAERADQVAHRGAVDEVTTQHVLPREHGQLGPLEGVESSLRMHRFSS